VNGATATSPNTRRTPRAYDNTLRREQADATRRRIVLAGSQLLHESDARDWSALTIRAVAERAGVNERTVYRHFENERAVRDAVMHQLEQEAGIDLEGMALDEVATQAARIFRHVSSFPSPRRPALDPTLSETRRRVHDALLKAVTDSAQSWNEDSRTMAAAVLDLLWSVGAYERLVGDWRLDPSHAVEAIGWAITLVTEAVRDDRHP